MFEYLHCGWNLVLQNQNHLLLLNTKPKWFVVILEVNSVTFVLDNLCLLGRFRIVFKRVSVHAGRTSINWTWVVWKPVLILHYFGFAGGWRTADITYSLFWTCFFWFLSFWFLFIPGRTLFLGTPWFAEGVVTIQILTWAVHIFEFKL